MVFLLRISCSSQPPPLPIFFSASCIWFCYQTKVAKKKNKRNLLAMASLKRESPVDEVISSNRRPIIFLAMSILPVLQLKATAIQDPAKEDEKEFNYDKEDEKGPAHWGDIHKGWAACGKGKMQSPIDLSDEHIKIHPELGQVRHTYRPATAILKNRGHDIMIKWENEAGAIYINGTEYALKQVHWHSPSEHSINGYRYSLEMHMVHESANNEIAVVGILYTIGPPDSFLSKMESYIKKVRDLKDKEEKVGTVDPRDIRRGSRRYYRYMGSLTVPPCTEGVVWTIVEKVRTVSIEQVSLLREAVHDDFVVNARPIQPINDRTVGMYWPRNVQY